MRVCQSTTLLLTHRLREQARSHSGIRGSLKIGYIPLTIPPR